MADMNFEQFEGGYSTAISDPGGVSRLVNLAGAVCSVALIVGLGVWGYKLAVRDVAGIPVIRALEGPLRIAPDAPGGEVVLHQGLSVNAVAAAGTAMPLAESLVLAPRPVELALDDEPGLVGADLATGEPEGSLLADVMLDNAAVFPVPVPQTQQDAVAMALAEALADGVEPLMPLSELSDTAVIELASVDSFGGTSRSPRPIRRPQDQMSAVAAPAPAAAASVEIDPATIAAGTRLAQLGAFDDVETAKAEWTKLQTRFAELLASKSMVVQAAQSGGRTFYRLRAHGFADEDEARRFCAALLAENAACIPVAHR